MGNQVNSDDLFDRLSHTDAGRNLLDEFERQAIAASGGYKRDQQWLCEDGWIILYTTTPMIGGPDDGKFMVVTYKPYGTGARGGRKTAHQWARTYQRAFVKRKTARARAEVLYWRHNPTRAANGEGISG